MQQTENIEASSFILNCYRPLLNGNNELIEKVGTEDLKIPQFTEDFLINLCNSAIRSLRQDNKTLLNISSPSIVIGDLHGNLHDLIRLMNSMIDIFSNRVLFLGDYIDRGQYQLETITLLLSLKIEYPDHFFLIRGNHEFAAVNSTGGFKDEILKSGYSETLFDKFNEVFSWLPIAAVINDHIFCVHGGLSPLFHLISQIETEFTLPITNIYTSSTNPKKKHRNSESSSLINEAINFKSTIINLNSPLNANPQQLDQIMKKKRFSESSCIKPKVISIKSSLLNLRSSKDTKLIHLKPNILKTSEDEIKVHLNAKLPPLASKPPLIKPNQHQTTTTTNPVSNDTSNASNCTQTSALNTMPLYQNSIANSNQQNPNSSEKVPSLNAVKQNLNDFLNGPNSMQQQQNAQLAGSFNANLPLTCSKNMNSISISENSFDSNIFSSLESAPNNSNLHLSSANQQNNSISMSSNSFLPQKQLESIQKLGAFENFAKESNSPNLKSTALSTSSSDGNNNIQLLTDIMWSDPTNSCDLFLPSNRGAGCYFGFVITNNFLKRNKMKMIVRGHESIKAGIETNHENKIVTIYSSSSLQLCGIAACATFDKDDNYNPFRLVPITFVKRSEAKFYTPTIKQSNKNMHLKLNSFTRSQGSFYGLKQSRKNFKISNNNANNNNELFTINENDVS